MEWFRSKHIHVLESPSQSADLNPNANLWQDFKLSFTDTLQPIRLSLSWFAEKYCNNIGLRKGCGNIPQMTCSLKSTNTEQGDTNVSCAYNENFIWNLYFFLSFHNPLLKD